MSSDCWVSDTPLFDNAAGATPVSEGFLRSKYVAPFVWIILGSKILTADKNIPDKLAVKAFLAPSNRPAWAGKATAGSNAPPDCGVSETPQFIGYSKTISPKSFICFLYFIQSSTASLQPLSPPIISKRNSLEVTDEKLFLPI